MSGTFGKTPTKKNDYSEYGCFRLVDAIFWSAIVDVVNGWRYYQNHPDEKLIQNRNYCSAVAFLRSNEKGKRIMRILDNLTDEQRANLIEKGGLASTYVRTEE